MTPGALRINLVTLFPEYFEGPLAVSLIGKAGESGLVEFLIANPRDFADDPREVDDYSFGGGPGMILAPDPIFRAVDSLSGSHDGPIVCMSASGRSFDATVAAEYADSRCLTLVCGRYEGIDQRVCDHLCTEELSIGDYVLAGGEAGALVVIEAVVRLRPGVMGNEASATTESHSPASGGLLEYPHFTRPAEYRGRQVPEVLRSGDHGAVDEWRRRESLRRTAERRPELLQRADLGPSDVEWLKEEGLWPSGDCC